MLDLMWREELVGVARFSSVVLMLLDVVNDSSDRTFKWLE